MFIPRFRFILSCLLCLCLGLTACGPIASTEPQAGPQAGLQAGLPHGSTDTSADEITAEPVFDEAHYVVIRTAEDLLQFHSAVNREQQDFSGKTVVFLADIDLTGYLWTPLDGTRLRNVTFDGRGHTLSHLEFLPHEPAATAPDEIGSGFVGVSTGALTFRDITFDHAHVTAYERAVACLVGLNDAGDATLTFDHVRVTHFTADGWMDYRNQTAETGGHPVSTLLGGFIGHNRSGHATFTDCTVEDLALSGFSNLAAFVGYDSTGAIRPRDFTGCRVDGATLTFSYCLAENYTPDMPRKFVSVFYNATDWADSTEGCLAGGNAYTDVYFMDHASGSRPYAPEDFRSEADT